MNIPFTKMHGIGNDYVYVNGYETVIADPVNVAKNIADRHFGVGGDGLIMIVPPEKGVDAHVRMRMFNADGSESEMCGNGIRCVCKYAHDHGLSKANPMQIQTGRGVLTLEYHTNGDGTVDRVTVDMGEPILQLCEIPVDPLRLLPGNGEFDHRLSAQISRFAGQDQVLHVTFVSMGNPHAVIYTSKSLWPDIQGVDLAEVGSHLECHPAFPQRMNVHIVQVHSPREVTMRTWERGSGITLACGTGASAVCVAGVLTNRTDREILAHLPGGDLHLRWDETTNHVFKTGPATEVFSGIWKTEG